MYFRKKVSRKRILKKSAQPKVTGRLQRTLREKTLHALLARVECLAQGAGLAAVLGIKFNDARAYLENALSPIPLPPTEA
jgi:hypothetical protein